MNQVQELTTKNKQLDGQLQEYRTRAAILRSLRTARDARLKSQKDGDKREADELRKVIAELESHP